MDVNGPYEVNGQGQVNSQRDVNGPGLRRTVQGVITHNHSLTLCVCTHRC